MDKLETSVREAREEDLPFIFNSFLRSFKQVGMQRYILDRTYYDLMHKWLEEQIQKQELLILCSPDNENFIFGWILGDKNNLTYVYVKNSYRSKGLAKRLLQELLGEDTKPRRVFMPILTFQGYRLVEALMDFNLYPSIQFVYVPTEF